MLACNTPSTGVDNVYVVGVVYIHRLGNCASVFTDVVLVLQCSPTWSRALVFTDVVSCSSVRFGVD